MAQDACESHALEERGLATGIGTGQQRQGLLVAIDGGVTKTVGYRIGIETEQDVPPVVKPHAVVHQLGHHAPVVLRPPCDRQPLIGFDQPTHGLFAVDLQRSELTSEVDQVVGFFRLEFGFQRRIDAVNGLPVDFRRPRVREHVERATQRSRFQKRSQMFPGLLHRFLNHMTRRIPEFSLKRCPVGQRFEKFCARKGHFCIVHGRFNLLIHVVLQTLDGGPQFVLDSSDVLDLGGVAKHAHGLGQAVKRLEGRAELLKRTVGRKSVRPNGFNDLAQNFEGFPVVREPVDGAFGQNERFVGCCSENQPTIGRLHGCSRTKPRHGLEHRVVLPRFTFRRLEYTTIPLQMIEWFVRNDHALVPLLLLLQTAKLGPRLALRVQPIPVKFHGTSDSLSPRTGVGNGHQ